MGRRIVPQRKPHQHVILVRDRRLIPTVVTSVIARKHWGAPNMPRYGLGNGSTADENELMPLRGKDRARLFAHGSSPIPEAPVEPPPPVPARDRTPYLYRRPAYLRW